MEQAYQIRGSAQSTGDLHEVPESARHPQQKPLFKVLEESAIDKSFAANEIRRSDKAVDQVLRQATTSPFADVSPVSEPTYPFSFPLCDLLICELDQPLTEIPCSEIVKSEKLYKPLHPLGLYRGSAVAPISSPAGSPLKKLAQFVYQKVVSRKPFAFQPHPKTNPSYLCCYVQEELECGHVATVHLDGFDTLTARKRHCSECAAVSVKKVSHSIKRSMERVRSKAAGESPWVSIAFAVGCGSLFIVGVFAALQKEDFFHVLERTSDFNLTLQQVHRGKVLAPAVMFFCEPQPFEAGHTLTSFKYEYHADKFCYSVAAYSLFRDAAQCPIVPANCWHTDCAHPMSDHVLCEGKPKF